jgi:hypothetical protein
MNPCPLHPRPVLACFPYFEEKQKGFVAEPLVPDSNP